MIERVDMILVTRGDHEGYAEYLGIFTDRTRAERFAALMNATIHLVEKDPDLPEADIAPGKLPFVCHVRDVHGRVVAKAARVALDDKPTNHGAMEGADYKTYVWAIDEDDAALQAAQQFEEFTARSIPIFGLYYGPETETPRKVDDQKFTPPLALESSNEQAVAITATRYRKLHGDDRYFVREVTRVLPEREPEDWFGRDQPRNLKTSSPRVDESGELGVHRATFHHPRVSR